jgi:hypothetical protein
MGICLEQTLIAGLFHETTSLYKENFIHHGTKISLKTFIPHYEKSLFPLDSKSLCFVTKTQRRKKSLKIQTAACNIHTVSKICEDFSFLNLSLDFLGQWQTALQSALKHLLNPSKKTLYFFEKTSQMYVLMADCHSIDFHTVIYLQNAYPVIDAALQGILKQLDSLDYDVFYIGNTIQYEKLLKEFFPKISKSEPLMNAKDYLLELGVALNAQNNHLNLLKKETKKPLFKRLLKKLTFFNLSFSLVLITVAFMFQIASNYKNCIDIKKIDPSFSSKFITKNTLLEKKQNLDTLSVFSKHIPQVPEAGELMAFFSSHPILNQIDPVSKKSASCLQMNYYLLDLQTLNVTLEIQFPQNNLENSFDQDLKQRKISFTKTKSAHLTTYEFLFKKGFIL